MSTDFQNTPQQRTLDLNLFPILDADSAEGHQALDRLLGRGSLVLDAGLRNRAATLVDTVRSGGDRALLDAVGRFDLRDVEDTAAGEALSSADLRLAPLPQDRPNDVGDDGGWHGLPVGFAEALDRAIEAVRAFHERQLHDGFRMQREGVELVENRWPLRRVGVYVPGGRASYPSTVVMTVVPAQLAGVEEIAVATPPSSYRTMPALRYTLARLGVHEVWGMGGAHAVAALAYGTESVRRVDKIVGPGNAWVTAAKALVMPDVAIDGLAGPTEVVIVAEGGADISAAWLAADLLAQAEHDPVAAPVLITDSHQLAEAVRLELAGQLAELATAETARASLRHFGTALVVRDLDTQALDLVERIAPEHLQLIGPRPEALAERVRNAGAVFVGASTPEVFGDYVAGPSHVLPTCGSARYASGLGVEDFVRRSHVVRFDAEAAAQWAEAAAILADAEGLPAHAAAARRRAGKDDTHARRRAES